MKAPIYQIFYATAETFRNCFDSAEFADAINLKDLTATHRPVASIQTEDEDWDERTDLSTIFNQMQGEIWSPNGEARDVILTAGLSHTSMSVGDVVVTEWGGVWLVKEVGFAYLGLRSGHKWFELH